MHRRDHFTEEKRPVFTTATGEGLRRSNVANRVVAPAAKAAGLVVDRDEVEVPWVGFHTFRHTFATWFRMYAGGDTHGLVATKNWKDHRSAARYEHVVARQEWDRVDKLPGAGAKRGKAVNE